MLPEISLSLFMQANCVSSNHSQGQPHTFCLECSVIITIKTKSGYLLDTTLVHVATSKTNHDFNF